jgi:hypothetical protein
MMGGPTNLANTQLCQWPTPEIFFLASFRCLLTGYDRWDASCWERAWLGARRMLPLAETKRTMADLSHFTRVFRSTLRHTFTYLPLCCGHVAEQECDVVRLVGAAQKGQLVVAGLIARRLTENPDHLELVDAASELGGSLRSASLVFTLTFEQNGDLLGSHVLH